MIDWLERVGCVSISNSISSSRSGSRSSSISSSSLSLSVLCVAQPDVGLAGARWLRRPTAARATLEASSRAADVGVKRPRARLHNNCVRLID